MLRTLTINDFALIDRLTLELGPGLNVFTGETGAGKSIILDALSLILGERARADLIRAERDGAYVEALFDTRGDPRILRCLEEHGLCPDPDGLIIAREISRSGKNRCFVNGRGTVLSCLKELGDLLVDIHGQHEHQRLLSPAHHMEILDAFGDAAYRQFLDETLVAIRGYREARRRLEELDRDRDRHERELEVLRFQAEEIDGARIAPGEDEELERQWRMLSRAEETQRELTEMSDALAGDEGPQVLRSMGRWLEQLGEIARDDERLATAASGLKDGFYLLQEVRRELDSFLSGFEIDGDRLAQVEERLSEVNRLKRKYGSTCDEILARRAEIGARIDELDGPSGGRGALEKRLGELRALLEKRLPELSKRRKRLAASLEKRVTTDLGDLSMKGASFHVQALREPVPGDGDVTVEGKGHRLFAEGLERVEFHVSTNPGEPVMPLVKVASGGELSRVTLALKSSLAVLDAVPIMVFDEIDAGIGGETATNVAEKLVQVSRHCQCLCITHLPQIASRGRTHFSVRKQSSKERTHTSVERLDAAARVTELARMLGGKSDVSLKLARQMLDCAGAGEVSESVQAQA